MSQECKYLQQERYEKMIDNKYNGEYNKGTLLEEKVEINKIYTYLLDILILISSYVAK